MLCFYLWQPVKPTIFPRHLSARFFSDTLVTLVILCCQLGVRMGYFAKRLHEKNAFQEPDKDLGEDEELQFPVQEFAGSIWLWCSSSGSLGAFRDISNVDFLLFVKKRNSTLLQRNPWHQPRVSEGGIPWNSTPARRVALLNIAKYPRHPEEVSKKPSHRKSCCRVTE